MHKLRTNPHCLVQHLSDQTPQIHRLRVRHPDQHLEQTQRVLRMALHIRRKSLDRRTRIGYIVHHDNPFAGERETKLKVWPGRESSASSGRSWYIEFVHDIQNPVTAWGLASRGLLRGMGMRSLSVAASTLMQSRMSKALMMFAQFSAVYCTTISLTSATLTKNDVERALTELLKALPCLTNVLTSPVPECSPFCSLTSQVYSTI